MYYLQIKALKCNMAWLFLSDAETSLPVPSDSVLGPTFLLISSMYNLEFGQVPIQVQCTFMHLRLNGRV